VYLWDRYLQAVLDRGALAVVLPVTDEPAQVRAFAERFDGFILAGGAFDVPAEYYGEEPRPWMGTIKPERSRFERALLQAALKKDKPVLGICGGMQLINVFYGGSLFQDILKERPGSLDHQQKIPKTETSHTVTIAAGTQLQAIMSGRRRRQPLLIRVNSTHHQAVKALGRGLVPAGLAPDGVIEAIESPRHRFLIGVQWHPEMLYEKLPEARRLFQAFIQAAAKKV
jgi:putative glutamine amidotransferase